MSSVLTHGRRPRVTDAATKLPAAGGYRPRGNITGRARCPQCGLISLDSGRCQFVVRHCPRCLTGNLQPVELLELNQASGLMVSHAAKSMTRERTDRERP